MLSTLSSVRPVKLHIEEGRDAAKEDEAVFVLAFTTAATEEVAVWRAVSVWAFTSVATVEEDTA